jgi:broad specificity phosphatase PhoE
MAAAVSTLVTCNMEIVLVRHGPPAPIPRRLVSGHDLGDWLLSFNAAGLSHTDAVPETTRELVKSVRCVLASDLPRSVESAKLLSSRGVSVDSDLREAGLPSSMGVSLRLPPGIWVVLARVAWWLNCRRSVESTTETRARAKRAADRLCALATEHGSVAVIGHGVFNRFIARQLRIRGWHGPRFLPTAHWAASRFTRAADPA